MTVRGGSPGSGSLWHDWLNDGAWRNHRRYRQRSFWRGMDERECAFAHVELECAIDRDHGVVAVAVLRQRELERRGAAHEESAATASLLLRDPVATAVL